MVRYGYASQAREEQMVSICLYVHVRVALPMRESAWSMAAELWQLTKYNFSYVSCKSSITERQVLMDYFLYFSKSSTY